MNENNLNYEHDINGLILKVTDIFNDMKND